MSVYGSGESYKEIIKTNQDKYPAIAQIIRPGWNLSFLCKK
jgi:hypothetical protein